MLINILPNGGQMELQKSIIAILDNKNKIIGTGFLVREDLALTCAHVVEKATAGLNEYVTLRFATEKIETTAQIEQQFFSPSYEQDIALLRVVSIPKGICPLLLGPAAASRGHKFYTYGYATVGNVQGIGARGQIVDVVDEGRLVQLSSQEPDHGMSGAPILDETSNLVVGMISKGKDKASKDGNLRNIQTTFATSTEAVRAVCPELPAPVPPENPFGDRGRIEDPMRYFVRQPITRELFDELRKRQSVSLVGDSQSGKSSLLWHVVQVGPQVLNRPMEDFAYFNLELVRSEEEFFEFLCETLGVANCRGYRLDKTLRGRHIYLCLDEVEKMVWQGFTQEIRSELRGLADGPGAPLTLVIASREPLARLFPDVPDMTSPLAGLCHPLTFTPFTLQEAIALVRFRLQGTSISLPDNAVETAWCESRGYPAALQKALHNVFEDQNRF